MLALLPVRLSETDRRQEADDEEVSEGEIDLEKTDQPTM